MLGLMKGKSYIDNTKPKFWRIIIIMELCSTSKRIFLQRTFQALAMPEFVSGLSAETVELCSNLQWALDIYVQEASMPKK